MELLHIKSREKAKNHFSNIRRKQGVVPGIIYGKNLTNTLVEIDDKELQMAISHNGEHGILEIDVNGKVHKALIKEVQKDSITQKIMHIDFEELSSDSKITSEVPLVFIGEEKLKEKGGILQRAKSSIKVRCEAQSLPKNINVDVTKLNFGQCIKVFDMEISKDISIIDEKNGIVATLTGAQTNFIESDKKDNEDEE